MQNFQGSGEGPPKVNKFLDLTQEAKMSEHFWVVNEDDDEVYGYEDNLSEREAEALLDRLSAKDPYSSWDIDSSRF